MSLKQVIASRRSEADAAYLLGIARQAAPLDRLVAKHGEFQKRMMTAAAMPPPPVPNAPSRRTALGVASSSSTAAPLSAAISRVPASSLQVDTRGPRPGSRPDSNARLQIFVDPSGAESVDAADSFTSYPDVGTRKSRVKENIPEVGKAAGSTLKQAGRTRRIASASSSAVASKIVPFRDPKPDEDMKTKQSAAAVPKTPARNSTTVPSHEVPNGGGIPATPRFTPFRDEVSNFSARLQNIDEGCAMDSARDTQYAGCCGDRTRDGDETENRRRKRTCSRVRSRGSEKRSAEELFSRRMSTRRLRIFPIHLLAVLCTGGPQAIVGCVMVN